MVNEMVHQDEGVPDGPSPAQIALLAGAGIALLFGAGVLAGVTMAFVDGVVKSPGKAALIAALGLALVIGSAIVLRKVVPHMLGGEVSPRTKRARTMVYLSGAIGGVIGIALQWSALGSDPRAVLSGPVPPVVAAVIIAVWLIAVPILSVRWWRNIDEHEALAYKDGALAGVFAYSAISPTWWVGWRGGFFPEPQEMLIYLAVVTVWGLVWMMRRYA